MDTLKIILVYLDAQMAITLTIILKCVFFIVPKSLTTMLMTLQINVSKFALLFLITLENSWMMVIENVFLNAQCQAILQTQLQEHVLSNVMLMKDILATLLIVDAG